MTRPASTTVLRQGDRVHEPLILLEQLRQRFAGEAVLRRGGRIEEVASTHLKVRGIENAVRLGDLVRIGSGRHGRLGEVVRISSGDVMVAPFEGAASSAIGEGVYARGPFHLTPDESWRGRVLDALGRPLDKGSALRQGDQGSQSQAAPAALERQRVEAPLRTGVRVVDIFTPLCYGQRIGIFAGSGVGKSTMLAMLACADAFDTVVLAMTGERGREVREFLEDTLGAEAMARTVAVVATSDESAMMRRRTPDTAMRIAEHFRDAGHRVLLLLDSVTRYAHAMREVGIAAGEPPVARGYPASVFTELPRLLERAGPGVEGAGSVTAIISVLVDGDDHNDPVADSVRGILDGHLVLSRSIAEAGRYPAVDPLASVSRLAARAWSQDERKLVSALKAMIARYEDTRDIRLLGAYQAGADGELDMAVRQVPLVYKALCQSPADGRTQDPFAELARHLRGEANGEA